MIQKLTTYNTKCNKIRHVTIQIEVDVREGDRPPRFISQPLSYYSSPEPMRKRVVEEEVLHPGKRLKFNLDDIEHVNPELVYPLVSRVKTSPQEFAAEVEAPEICVSRVVYSGTKRVRKPVSGAGPPSKKVKTGGAKRVATPYKAK
jgi:hypothetical protein